MSPEAPTYSLLIDNVTRIIYGRNAMTKMQYKIMTVFASVPKKA